MISDKEVKQQLDELKEMLLPEMASDKLNYLNVGKPEGHDDLFKALESSSSGSDLISLLQKRIEKVLHFRRGKDNDNDASIENTELGNLNDNIIIICNQLVQLTSPPEFNEASIDILEQVITTAIIMGYTAGSHDMKVNLERHGEKGYKSSIQNPKKAGDAKAKQNIAVKNLVNQMAGGIKSDSKIGKVTSKNLSAAIYDVVSDFSNKGNNKNIKAFKNFENKYPEQRPIKDWINALDLHDTVSTTARTPSYIRLVEHLQEKFPSKRIREILNNK